MASTNKTTNYELSQFLGTDKPAWLSDYNTDMNKIDTQMKANADGVTSVSGTAGATATALGDITNLATTDKTSAVAAINEVNIKATTAQGTATSAGTTANEAKTTAETAITELNRFNLTNTVNLSQVTASAGTIVNNTLKIQKDSTGSVYKFYGQLYIGNLNGIQGTLTIQIGTNSGLQPTSAYDVECGILIDVVKTGGLSSLGVRKFRVETNGTITIPSETLDGNTTAISLQLFPCLYFNQNFGD